jgi:hypothetical protein
MFISLSRELCADSSSLLLQRNRGRIPVKKAYIEAEMTGGRRRLRITATQNPQAR